MNGVTHSLLRVIDHLTDRGDEVLVIAPGTGWDGPAEVAGARIVTVPALPVPTYRSIRVAPSGVSRIRVAPGRVTRIHRLLGGCAPDIVHLASPFVLG